MNDKFRLLSPVTLPDGGRVEAALVGYQREKVLKLEWKTDVDRDEPFELPAAVNAATRHLQALCWQVRARPASTEGFRGTPLQRRLRVYQRLALWALSNAPYLTIQKFQSSCLASLNKAPSKPGQVLSELATTGVITEETVAGLPVYFARYVAWPNRVGKFLGTSAFSTHGR